MKRILLALALLALGGCTTQWVHPDPYRSNQAGFDKDWYECQYEAKSSAASMNVPSYDLNYTLRVQELSQMCMQVRGWRPQ